MRQHERTIEEIEAEMAVSRAEIEKTSQALKQTVNTDHLSEAARHVLLEGTARVEEKVKELAGSAGDQVESLGSLAAEGIRNNPVPALIASMGLGLLVSLAERDSRQALEEFPLNRASARLASSQDHPASVPARALREIASANQRSPMLVGAAVFGVGLLLGALLPSTRREDEVMGPYRNRWLADGKDSARQILHQAKSAIKSEVDKRRSEVVEVKDDMEAVALRAFHDARASGDGERNT